MMKYTLVLHGAEGSEGFTSLVSLNSRTVERGQGAEKQPKHQGAKTGALFINYTTKRRRMMAVLRVFLLGEDNDFIFFLSSSNSKFSSFSCSILPIYSISINTTTTTSKER
ncbi:uncharacterized protein DS421_16g551410 [Arachis hypogaea]|nr:uncharacterized protein DS421_16g551410 [Arachis hypogaea]